MSMVHTQTYIQYIHIDCFIFASCLIPDFPWQQQFHEGGMMENNISVFAVLHWSESISRSKLCFEVTTWHFIILAVTIWRTSDECAGKQ